MVEQAVPSSDRHIHMTARELHGLRAIVLYLHSLAPTRKNVPDVLTNAAALIQDVRTLVEQHRKDQNNLAVTGVPIVTLLPLVSQKTLKKPLSSSLLMTKVEPTPGASTASIQSSVLASGIGSLRPSVIVKKEEPPVKDEPEEEEEDVNPAVMVKQSPFPHWQNHFKQLQQQQQQNQDSAKKLKQPTYVVRPALVGPIDPKQRRKEASRILLGSNSNELELILRPEILIPVFRYLSVHELLVCMRVCRAWNQNSIDPSLWKIMDLSHRHLTPIMLAGIIRRQPRFLILDWSSLTPQQCAWIMDRLPHLASLSLQGISAACLSALKLPAPSPSVPYSRSVLPKLTVLDLSWVSGLNDLLLEKSVVVAQPPHRLTNLKRLALSGSSLTDRTLNSIASCFPVLKHLCVAFCLQFSPNGLRSLWTANEHLTRIDLTGCTQLSDDYESLRCEAASVRPNLTLPEDITSDSQPVHRCIPITLA